MINRDEWMAAIKDAESAPPPESDALSLMEFAALVGLGRAGATARMEKLVASGKAIRTTKVIRMVNGGLRTVPAWRLVDPS